MPGHMLRHFFESRFESLTVDESHFEYVKNQKSRKINPLAQKENPLNPYDSRGIIV